ncbi:thiamine phosphate synthase [Thalassotalea sp. PLHSN55]|uniref:thiamine phosphate synthase n=1 Tax=Thalassotalea sp. PLHSN55 TaxID=3435888 RepID=UPI003F8421FF
MTDKAIVWSISGSDCSGGAGIAADIKTAQALGCELCYLITANTAQNSQKLVAVNPVSIDILDQQAQTLLADKLPAVVKIGLVASKAQITWLCQLLAELKQQNSALQVVFDPVGSASVGGKFSSLSTQDFKPLLALVDVITPNLIEAQALSSGDCNNETESESDNPQALAENIAAFGINSVIIKAGHSDNKTFANDYCLHKLKSTETSNVVNGETISYQLNSPRINSHFSHGGGCSFASAISCYLAQGYLLRDAFTLAKTFINQGLKANEGKCDYYGAFEQVSRQSTPSSLNQNRDFFPQVQSALNLQYQHLAAFKSLEQPRNGKQSLGLYPVVDSLAWLEKLLPCQLNIIQLRVKNLAGAALEETIKKAIALYKNSNTRLFINDYWQLAIKHGAYGVHIGQEDLQDADLAAIEQSGLRLGISTHGCYEFLLAQQLKPSYLAVGAIFPTKTKDMTGQIQGIDNLSQILTLTTDIPVVAIGGINHQRAEQVWQTGVDSIAVVTAITEAEDYRASVNKFKALLTRAIN